MILIPKDLSAIDADPHGAVMRGNHRKNPVHRIGNWRLDRHGHRALVQPVGLSRAASEPNPALPVLANRVDGVYTQPLAPRNHLPRAGFNAQQPAAVCAHPHISLSVGEHAAQGHRREARFGGEMFPVPRPVEAKQPLLVGGQPDVAGHIFYGPLELRGEFRARPYLRLPLSMTELPQALGRHDPETALLRRANAIHDHFIACGSSQRFKRVFLEARQAVSLVQPHASDVIGENADYPAGDAEPWRFGSTRESAGSVSVNTSVRRGHPGPWLRCVDRTVTAASPSGCPWQHLRTLQVVAQCRHAPDPGHTRCGHPFRPGPHSAAASHHSAQVMILRHHPQRTAVINMEPRDPVARQPRYIARVEYRKANAVKTRESRIGG